LVDADDLDKADRWFERHENAAVLLGRCAPVVRSLVSIPAGANWMALGRFTVFTAIGSGVRNALLIGAALLAWRTGPGS
jgi:membrane protein DedA with SNARE-associated domain